MGEILASGHNRRALVEGRKGERVRDDGGLMRRVAPRKHCFGTSSIAYSSQHHQLTFHPFLLRHEPSPSRSGLCFRIVKNRRPVKWWRNGEGRPAISRFNEDAHWLEAPAWLCSLGAHKICVMGIVQQTVGESPRGVDLDLRGVREGLDHRARSRRDQLPEEEGHLVFGNGSVGHSIGKELNNSV